MAIEGGYEPFAVDVDAPDGASAEAAVAAAAHRILVHYLPAQAPTILDPAYAASLATIPDGQAKTDGVAVGESVAAAAHRPAGRRRLPGAGDVHAAEPADPRRLAPDRAHAADRHLPRADAAVQPRLGRPVPARTDRRRSRSKKWAREYNEVKEIGSSTSTTRTAEQTLAARFWAEPPVQQARGSFRKFVLDHQLDVVRGGAVHGDGLGDLRRRPHRLLRRQVPLRVLAADHRDPRRRHRRQRRDRRRSRRGRTLLPATPNHPEYPSAHSCITPAGGRVIAEIPRDAADRLHRPEPDRPRRPSLRRVPRIWSTRSATPASGAASTSAPRSRTASRSARRPPTRCSRTTSSGRTTSSSAT